MNGKQVRIRNIERGDLEAIVALNNDPVVRANVVGWMPPSSLEEQQRWFETLDDNDRTVRWAVIDEEDRFLGITGLWDLDRRNRKALTALKLGGRNELRGRGLGTDAIKIVMAYAFYEVGLNRLYGSILDFNQASYRAYVDKCGWSVEGTSRQSVFRGGGLVDEIQVGILREDFEKLPDAADYIELAAGAVL